MSLMIEKGQYNLGDKTQWGVVVEKPEGVMPENIYKYPDPIGGPKINQFAVEYPGEPFRNVMYCTQGGEWDDKNKMRTAMFTNEGPWPEAVLVETNHEEDDTFGVAGPLVCVLNNGESLIAVNRHSMRRWSGSEGLIEAPRRRHGNTDMMPGLKDSNIKPEEYTKEQLGLSTTNTACIQGQRRNGEFTVARIRAELSVVRGVDEAPKLKDGFDWMDAGEYTLLTLDGVSQVPYARAQALRIVPLPTENQMHNAQVKLQAFIADQCSGKK